MGDSHGFGYPASAIGHKVDDEIAAGIATTRVAKPPMRSRRHCPVHRRSAHRRTRCRDDILIADRIAFRTVSSRSSRTEARGRGRRGEWGESPP